MAAPRIRAERIVNPLVLAPMINRKRYVSLSDSEFYGNPDGPVPADAYARTQSFFTAAQGREAVIDNTITGADKVFRFTNRNQGVLALPTRGRLIFEGKLDFSAFGTSGTRKRYMQSSGTAGPLITPTTNLALGASSVTVSPGAAATWKAGDSIYIGAATGVYSANYPTVFPAEWQTVQEVVGDVVHFFGFLRGAYALADGAFVQRIDPTRLQVDNLQFDGAGSFAAAAASGDYGLTITLGDGVVINGGTGRFADFQNVAMQNCRDWTIRDFTSVHDSYGITDRIQYGVAIVGGSEGGLIDNCYAYGGKHGFVWTGGSIYQGVARNDRVRGGKLVGTWHHPIATHTTHEKLIVEGYPIFEACAGGADLRVQEVQVDGIIARNPIGGKNGSIASAVNLRGRVGKADIKNVRTLGYRFGVRLAAYEAPETGESTLIEGNVSDITITSCHFEDSYKAIELANDTAATLGNVTITGNVIDGAQTHAIELNGHWDRPNVSSNVFRNGSGARCIWIRGASFALGPIDPVARGNVYDSSYSEPLIQFTVGVARTDGNVAQGAAVPLFNFPEVTLAQLLALDATTLKGPYRVTDAGVGGSLWISTGAAWVPTGPITLASSSAPGAAIVTTTGTRIDAVAPVLVKAGLLRNGRRVEIDATFSYTNSANAKTLQVSYSNSTGGAGTLYASIAPTTSLSTRLKPMIVAEGDAAQRGAPSALVGGTGNTSGAIVVSAVDATVDSYIRITGQLANAADSISLDHYSVRLIP